MKEEEEEEEEKEMSYDKYGRECLVHTWRNVIPLYHIKQQGNW